MDVHDLCRIGNIHTKQQEKVIELLEALVKQGEEITKLAGAVERIKSDVANLEARFRAQAARVAR